MRAPSATRAQSDVAVQAAVPRRSRKSTSSRTMLTRSMARAQLAGSAGDRLLPAVESSVAAAVRALRQAQARLSGARAARCSRVCSAHGAGYRGAHGHVIRSRCVCNLVGGHTGAPAFGAARRLSDVDGATACSDSTPSSAETSACRCQSALGMHRCARARQANVACHPEALLLHVTTGRGAVRLRRPPPARAARRALAR